MIQPMIKLTTFVRGHYKFIKRVSNKIFTLRLTANMLHPKGVFLSFHSPNTRFRCKTDTTLHLMVKRNTCKIPQFGTKLHLDTNLLPSSQTFGISLYSNKD